MADYKIVAQTYLDRLYEPGDVLRNYDGPANKAMVLIEPPAPAEAPVQDAADENPPAKPVLRKQL